MLKFKIKEIISYDFVIIFKQTSDKFKQARIPISLLFKSYVSSDPDSSESMSDLDIIKLCNPHNDVEFELFLIDVFRVG